MAMKFFAIPLLGGVFLSIGLPVQAFHLTPSDSLGAVTSTDYLSLSTGTGDRAISSLGSWLTGDKYRLADYGTEGSGAKWVDLENGVYEIEWEIFTKDLVHGDNLTFWNRRETKVLADNSIKDCVLLASGKCSTAQFTSGRQRSTVDVMYNELALLGLDVGDKKGTSEIKIHGINRIAELAYEAPQVITLAASDVLGDIRFKEGYTSITTGSKDRAVSTVSEWMGRDLSALGTEGSGAMWTDLRPGRYELTWQVYASEDDAERDAFYLWDGEGLQEFATRAIATHQRSATRWDSEWVTTTIDIYGNELGFIGLDTVDKSGTSELRVSLLERVGAAVPRKDSAKTPEPSSLIGLGLLVFVKKFFE
ncbi:hypothetical protein Lepto7375DRAFT_0974 [Leptolyngbya sp. PCC 7375]|nr:hypothetical protein Lepto7375DRAFT_0974 [Leptolyngbya sp. PCC 7375]